jgi:hypothetical protein
MAKAEVPTWQILTCCNRATSAAILLSCCSDSAWLHRGVMSVTIRRAIMQRLPASVAQDVDHGPAVNANDPTKWAAQVPSLLGGHLFPERCFMTSDLMATPAAPVSVLPRRSYLLRSVADRPKLGRSGLTHLGRSSCSAGTSTTAGRGFVGLHCVVTHRARPILLAFVRLAHMTAALPWE